MAYFILICGILHGRMSLILQLLFFSGTFIRRDEYEKLCSAE
jgi:hypothetical protein